MSWIDQITGRQRALVRLMCQLEKELGNTPDNNHYFHGYLEEMSELVREREQIGTDFTAHYHLTPRAQHHGISSFSTFTYAIKSGLKISAEGTLATPDHKLLWNEEIEPALLHVRPAWDFSFCLAPDAKNLVQTEFLPHTQIEATLNGARSMCSLGDSLKQQDSREQAIHKIGDPAVFDSSLFGLARILTSKAKLVDAITLELNENDTFHQIEIDYTSRARLQKWKSPPPDSKIQTLKGQVCKLFDNNRLELITVHEGKAIHVRGAFEEGQTEMARNAWKKDAVVEGVLEFDRHQRPRLIHIKQITLRH